ncbi:MULTISPECIES: DUF7507 domain-containing protein [unclassified Streptomyces]|uniref:DUF7507 domain-containing protein n=1 Tax=unclassified Streptomyces TaxID=2593676 RepID=UPI00081B4AC3|nr:MULTISPECIES: hypothetical protein [unclassified Streptomyces]SCD28418.1 conserved repeat domain-containing protein/fimbrial isopeptide formation D2 domain-containing protein [Streptomyces sp. DpondAA-D4]
MARSTGAVGPSGCAATLTEPGAFGGSLGYAQKLSDDDPALPFTPGVDHGNLGVGLDVLGNCFGDWEHRGNGCETTSPAGTAFRIPAPGANMVTLRGPGDGTTGYCFLTATTSNFSTTGPWPSTLPGQLQGPTTSLPAGVTPAAVPSTYKFGFAASTGLFTDVHLIRNVSVHPAAALPQLNLVKQVSAASDVPLPLTPGQQVPYEYVVTNSGNTTLTDVNVTDDRVTGISCPGTTLASGRTMTCTGTYTVTEADGLAGSVTNTALAHGTTPGGTMVDSPPSEVTLPVQRGPGLRLEKTVDEDRVYRAGDEVSYTYTVTNTGPTELTGIGVTDDRVDGITCQATTLAPGASTTCTGTYTVRQQDAERGNVINIAFARGQSGATTVESPPDTARVDVVTNRPALRIEKSVDDSRPYRVGERITYTYTVTNTGNTELSDVTVVDDRVTDVTCRATTLAPGASTTCTGTYTVTEADAVAGEITNVAVATADNGTVRSEPDQATVQVESKPCHGKDCHKPCHGKDCEPCADQRCEAY